MPKLGFSIPFSGFSSTTFINCLASVYLYLEGISAKAGNVTFCNEWENGQCNGCGNCATKPQALQEKYFFLFDTMCGHSSLRCRFDGTPTEMEKLINDCDFYDGARRITSAFCSDLRVIIIARSRIPPRLGRKLPPLSV